MKVLKLVQFLDSNSDTVGQGDDFEAGEFKYLFDENDSYEFYDGDDDDGDSMYSDRDCVSFTGNEKDVKVGRRLSYVEKAEINYSIVEIELEEA